MFPRRSPFAVWLLALAMVTLATGLRAASPLDGRFSQTLAAEEKASSGLARLTSDHVAVIDALVRKDTGRRGTLADGETPARFSQRLSPSERKAAGLEALAEGELPQLDALIERYQNAKLARTLLAPPTYLSRHSRVQPTETKAERKIHGSFSLSYGFGKGGYSEKSGSMVLNYTDPDKGYSVSIGYTETHRKGGRGYYGPDPFFDERQRLPDLRDPSAP